MQTKTKQQKPPFYKHIPMFMARLVCAPLVLIFRMRRITPEGKPFDHRIEGGAILAVNHTGFIDTFVAGVAVWYRRMFFLAAEVVMRNKLRSWLLGGVGAIKIDRNAADIEAIRKSVQVLKEGELLTVFPQGSIQQEQQVRDVKSGAVLIALQAGVPLIPMYICPTKHWYSRRTVVIGEPFDPKAFLQKKFPSAADMDRAAQELARRMNQCVVHE